GAPAELRGSRVPAHRAAIPARRARPGARRHRRLHRQLRGDRGSAAARGARRARPGRQDRRATLRAPTAAGLPRDRPGARPGGTRSQPRLRLMASEVGGEQRCGTGARLRDAREKAGLSLAQAAESLHLDPRTLEALEAEDFAAPGAGATQASAGAAATQASAGAAALPAPGATQLGLKFSGLSWVEVSDASGRRLLQGLYAAGSAPRTVSGAPPLRVVLGNAAAVGL